MAETSNETLKDLNERLESLRTEASELADKAVTAVRGAYNRTLDSATRYFEDLVKTGEKLEKQKEKSAKKTAGQKTPQDLRARIATTLGLPTREELEAVNKKLDTLSRKLRKLEKSAAA